MELLGAVDLAPREMRHIRRLEARAGGARFRRGIRRRRCGGSRRCGWGGWSAVVMVLTGWRRWLGAEHAPAQQAGGREQTAADQAAAIGVDRSRGHRVAPSRVVSSGATLR